MGAVVMPGPFMSATVLGSRAITLLGSTPAKGKAAKGIKEVAGKGTGSKIPHNPPPTTRTLKEP